MPSPSTAEETLIEDDLDTPAEGAEDAPGSGTEADEDTLSEEGDGGIEASGEGEGGESEGQLVIGFEGEDEPEGQADAQRAPSSWVTELRKRDREKAARIRELERKLAAAAPSSAPVVGPEPTFEDCGNDPAVYRDKLSAWTARKAAADAEAKRQRDEQEAQARTWTQRLARVDAEEARLGVAGADDAREAFMSQLSDLQRAIIMHAYEDPQLTAKLRYAIGRSPTELARLAAIQDPTRFAVAIAELRQKMKTNRKGPAPKPETRVRPGTPGAGAGSAVDNQLERLRAEAERTRDQTKVIAYLAQKKKQG